MKIRSGLLAGSSLQKKKYTHLFLFFVYFFEDKKSSYIGINRVSVSEY